MNEETLTSDYQHFADKDAIVHVIEKKADGVVALVEAHGIEIPGHVSAAADAARESALALLLIWVCGFILKISQGELFIFLLSFSSAWIVWKSGRSAWLAWSRLERLHRVIDEEKYEIEHHRDQERIELTALYKAKGFEGKLLQDVIDVLMSDDNKLLKVMLQEELGLALEAHEHPLKQSVGAAIGAFCSCCVCLLLTYFFSLFGMFIASFSLIGLAALVSARFEKNRIIPAIVWNLSIGILSVGFVYYILSLLMIVD